ncbi:DUF4185 domain-containing protein [Bythopirellula polymerisocia]|uniref:Uncharacterized protein n=1 Tax=Bythopirellula polymerisocia TaxID=2528003 RepID=A0A5C6D0P0_9BACT|nr:DUF4185 domain-containing protein [Bythopirellula polymerisocia]TWU28449.1 hypothetical protein Pla144_17390 [Bythopirellula polymerisocia]
MHRLLEILRGCLLLFTCGLPALAQDYHAIQVLDSETGRGVPLVKIQANGQDYFTDSNGLLAFGTQGELDQNVDFSLSSYGYTSSVWPLLTTIGTTSQVTIQREQFAERLYRVTGKGIYQDTVLLGQIAPIQKPLINANVKGQDSVQSVIYKGQLHWFWGDTLYDVGFGNFRTSGATSQIPGQGGLDPAVGVDLSYYVDAAGSSKQMMPLSQPGPVWIDGLFTVHDNSGREVMLTHYSRRDPKNALGAQVEHGLARFNDSQELFQRHQVYPLSAPIVASGHSFEHTLGGQEYIYFAESYPNIRVKKNWNDVNDPAQWEAFTPLIEGSLYDPADPPLELDFQGKPVYGWKKNTQPMNTDMMEQLAQNGFIQRDESPFRLKDFVTGDDVRLHRASVYWNEYRENWIMIGNQAFGDSFLGEVWFAEAPTPEGPWENAVKVVTHHDGAENYTLYNPKQHPYFSEEGGRYIYFEGTYANTFSGNPIATPLYDYNQVMYRLDLSLIPSLSMAAIPGDFGHNGFVDSSDLAIWKKGYGDNESSIADADGDADTDGEDFLTWQRNFTGSASLSAARVPEPGGVLLVISNLMMLSLKRRPERVERVPA